MIVSAVVTTIVDLPSRRPHAFSALEITQQSYLVVQVRTEEGITGLGEGGMPGAWWGGESPETMKAIIDRHLAAAVVGQDGTRTEALRAEMDRVVAGALFAKSALEMALLDAKARALGVPMCELLGGQSRDRLPVTWALSAAGVNDVVDEIERKIDQGHERFKFKMGALDPDEDVQRATAIMAAFDSRASFIADPNGTWDELTTVRCGGKLADAGLKMLEQPVPGWNLEGLARLADRLPIPVMADEGVKTASDALRLATVARTAAVISLKLPKAGGPLGNQRVAAVAQAAGFPCFGGTTLEGSIGTAACLHAYCALPTVSEGCELVGPALLADDIVVRSLHYDDGSIALPKGSGLGIELDDDKLAAFARGADA